MIRLLIDGTPITINPKGVGRYAYHLCLQLAERLPSGWKMQILLDPSGQVLFPKDFRADLIPVRRTSELSRALFVIPTQARRLKSELLLKTHESAGLVRGVPTITVCHDIDHLITAAQGEKRGPVRMALDLCKTRLRRRALENSDFVICNSQFTCSAVAKYYAIPAKQTAVAYCAVDPRFYELSVHVDKNEVRNAYGVPNFILAFATGDARENFHAYPQVAARMMSLGLQACLLIAGVRREHIYASSLRNQFAALGLQEGRDFIFEDFLGGDRFRDLVKLYTAADFYLDLSLHEGFGMQLVEAMACGTTCISSDRGALEEVGDKYALFIDPENAEEIAQVVKKAYECSMQKRDNQDQVSYTRKFSWENVGNTVVETLASVAAERLGFLED